MSKDKLYEKYRVTPPVLSSSSSESDLQEALAFEAAQGISQPISYIIDFSALDQILNPNYYLPNPQPLRNPTLTSPTNMAPPAPTLTILDPDGPLNKLPPFPFSDELLEADSATISHRKNELQKLKILYSEFNNLKHQIKIIELTQENPREDKVTNIVKELRKQLSELSTKIHGNITAIESILSLQRALKPSLEIPTDYIEGYINNDRSKGSLPLQITEVKQFLKPLSQDSAPQDIEQIWKKLIHYTKLRKLSHHNFKMALSSCVQGDLFTFLTEIAEDSVEKIAKALASRFLTETTFNSAITNLKSFSRASDEPIRQTITRLTAYVNKAAVIYPEPQREAITDFTISLRLRDLLSPKVRQELDKRSDDSLRAGKRMPLNEMVEFIESQERIYGQPQMEMTTSIQLNNTESSPMTESKQQVATAESSASNTALDSKLDKLTSLVNSLANVVLYNQEQQSDSPEINAAIRNVKFTDKDKRPVRSLTPYSRPPPSQGTTTNTPTQMSQGISTPQGQPSTSSIPSRPTADRRPSRSDYASNKTRYPSYEARHAKSRETSQDKLHYTRKPSSDRYNRSRSTSPATWYKNKAHITEQLLKDISTSKPPPPSSHQPATMDYTPSQGTHTQQPRYPSANSNLTPQDMHTSAYQPAQYYPYQKDQLYTQKLNDYKYRKYNEKRNNTVDGRERSKSRERPYPTYKQYRTPSNYRTPVVNAYPNSHVTLNAACPFCHSPVDHPIELCHVAQADINEINQELNE